VTIIEQTVHNR